MDNRVERQGMGPMEYQAGTGDAVLDSQRIASCVERDDCGAVDGRICAFERRIHSSRIGHVPHYMVDGGKVEGRLESR